MPVSSNPFDRPSMTAEEFIAAIRFAVHDSAVRDVMSSVEKPPGRKPSQRLLDLSAWYNNLPKSDRDCVRDMVLQGVHAALFGLLAVIDGSRVIEAVGEKSDFVILQRRGESESLELSGDPPS
jgi:hypothetical protein